MYQRISVCFSVVSVYFNVHVVELAYEGIGPVLRGEVSVTECPRVFQCAPQSFSVFQYVSVCLSVSQYVLVCFSMFQHVSVCFNVHVVELAYEGIGQVLRGELCVSECPRVFQCAPQYFSVFQCVPVCVSVYQYVSVCFSMFQRACS
jgi:hypothetical protein